MAQLRVYKDNGVPLFDTNYICYGLVRSGYMAYIGNWSRKTLRSANLDPNDGSNWTTTSWVGQQGGSDAIHGFVVVATAPIVFITGPGCLAGSSVTGSTYTFYYTGASTSTRFYCFDWMANNIAGSPYLKTYAPDGRITFNSLQPPLNIIAAVQAPTPGPLDFRGNYTTTYIGGGNRIRKYYDSSGAGSIDSYIDIGLGGEEYAAYLPFSRTCGTTEFMTYPGGATAQYGMNEGVSGYFGGITFMFSASGGTTDSHGSSSGWASPCSFFNIPTDRYPVALVIRTSSYPFPYN